MSRIILDKFKILNQIGEGSFGIIYKGIDIATKQFIAIKIEKIENRKSSSHSQLKTEAKIYERMHGTAVSKSSRWPRMHMFREEIGQNIMVMDILGPNLDFVIKKLPGNPLHPCAVAYVADKMIQLLESFHKKGFVHRDLKPQNFVIEYFEKSFPKKPELFLIDYGLAKRYIEPDKKSHAPFSQKRSMKGTIRYSSINTHLGIEQSRRDDMQSLGYIFVYMLLGELPWQPLLKNRTKKEGYHAIMIMKMKTPIEKLVENIPEPMKKAILLYLSYTMSLMYHEEPNYNYCKSLFKNQSQSFKGFQRLGSYPII